MVRTRLAKMYLIIALCLFCGWAAPLACRSVDINDPSEDMETFVAHHHHEGNIAELLIPLLERSLAQSEARSSERQHRRNKSGKKVIQMLPYGSEENKRKGWRKLNSHKKQVVEITPLHGKNRAKPLAYILSAAKPSHGEHNDDIDDVSSASTSDLEFNKSTSEEEQSSEEDENVNTLRTGDGLDFPSASSNIKSEENEDINVNTLRAGDDFDSPSNVESSEVLISEESKDLSGSDKEYSGDMTAESVDESEAERKVVDESESVNKHSHHYKDTLRNAENEAVSLEDVDLTVDDVPVTAEKAENLKSGNKHTHYYKDTLRSAKDEAVTLDDVDFTVENAPVIAEDTENVVTVENRDATAESTDVSVEDKYVTLGNLEPILENAVEYRAATADLGDTIDADIIDTDALLTYENDLLAVENEPSTLEENETSEGKTGDDKTASIEEDTNQKTAELISDTNTDNTYENDDVIVNNDVIVERAATEEESYMYAQPTHTHFHQNDDGFSKINHLIENYGAHKDATIENDDFVEDPRDFIGDDIIITRGQNDLADKSISTLFNDDATDVIEIQSSDETSKDAHKDCLESEKHHDYKTYKLSFMFNK